VPYQYFATTYKTAQSFKREMRLQMVRDDNLTITDDFFAFVPQPTFQK
jgi:hypothetical protein